MMVLAVLLVVVMLVLLLLVVLIQSLQKYHQHLWKKKDFSNNLMNKSYPGDAAGGAAGC